MAQLEDAMDIASSKGARSTLVLMKGMALVVAPQSQDRIHGDTEDRMKVETCSPQLDSAVIVDRQ
jgi:hypothetical protein